MADEDMEVNDESPVKRFVVYDYYADAKDFPEFSVDEIDVFAEAFEEFDTDGSGAISASELESAFKKMGQGATKETIAELVQEFDADKSGEIDWKEYLMMMRNFYPWKRAEYVMDYLVPAENYPEFDPEEITIFADAFREADVDHSGTIDTQELQSVFHSMGQGCSEDEAQEILEEFDDDKSGFIEFGEFLEIMRTCFYPLKRIIYEAEFYGPAVKSPEFSRSEIDTFARSFKKFDKDGSGSIDIDELSAMFKQMGQGVTKDDIQLIIDVFDTDKSGEIEWPEFIEIMKTFYPWKRLEYLIEFYEPAQDFPEFTNREIDVFSLTFREFDLDGSGSIDARELGIALKKMGQGASPEKIKSIIDEVDDNGNGEIEWPEYLKIMRSFYPQKLKDFEKKFLEPAKQFPEFDHDDVMVFVDSFREYDLDGSGSIDARELEHAFKKMGQGASKEKIAQILADFDDNGNGEISWTGFLKLMKSMYSARFESKSGPKAAPSKPVVAPKAVAPAPSPVKSNVAPVKASPSPSSPVKTSSTSSAPANKTASPAPTPVKTTTFASSSSSSSSSSPSKPATTTSTSSTPVKTSSFGTTKPTTSGSGTASTFASHRASNQCVVCSKTVYPIEAISANEQTFHKGCFKCQEPGCGLSLSLSTFKGVAGKVYCGKHAPAHKPTQLTVQGSMSTANAVNAPKINKAQGIKKNERMTFAPGELKPLGESGEES